MTISLPCDVRDIISKLNEHGYEAYAVGGCIRDSLMNRKPEDWDITTDALPQEVKKIFHRTIDTGIEHGTVTVMYKKIGYEVTTYRIDGDYTDARHPDSVTFTRDIVEDLKRRDFTINAMAYADDKGIVDPFDGMADIEKKVIRCVGNPDERFTEDALRILRAIRFASQLDFAIDLDTYEAISRHAPNLIHVSKERIFTELNKTVLSDNPEKLIFVHDTHIDRYVADIFKKIFDDDAFLSYASKLKNIPKDRSMRWAGVMCNLYQEDVQRILTDLKSDNNTIRQTSILVREIAKPLPIDKKDIRRCLARIGSDLFDKLIMMKKAGFVDASDMNMITKSEDRKSQIIEDCECYELKNLALTGKDLIEMGYKAGPHIGEILSRLLDIVIEHPEYNTKERLVDFVE